jgi:methionyl aminopeptidase
VAKCQVFSPAEIESFRMGGKILCGCLEEVAKAVRPGITAIELDRIAEKYIRDRGGLPAFKGYNGFPGTLCLSFNEEAVHGIPGIRELKEGDILSLDGGVRYDDLVTDACITVPVGEVSADAKKLLRVTEEALKKAVGVIRAGCRVGDISHAVQTHVEGNGCFVLHALTGHGLGNSVHHFPDIPNHGRPGTGPVLPAGTVIAVEPITSLGTESIREKDDGWTIVTKDGSLSAHFEHTLLVTVDGCEIIA